MKKILLIVIFGFLFLFAYPQQLEPVDPGGEPQGAPLGGGGAPIGNGLYLLLRLSAVYGIYKVMEAKKENPNFQQSKI